MDTIAIFIRIVMKSMIKKSFDPGFHVFIEIAGIVPKVLVEGKSQ